MKSMASASFGIALMASTLALQISPHLLCNQKAAKLSIKQFNVMCHSPKRSVLEALN